MEQNGNTEKIPSSKYLNKWKSYRQIHKTQIKTTMRLFFYLTSLSNNEKAVEYGQRDFHPVLFVFMLFYAVLF
jgi:hypothetical protein